MLRALVVGLGLAACRATPEPLPFLDDLAPPKAMVLRAGHYAGTSIGGPTPGAGKRDVEVDPARLFDLAVHGLYVRRAPAELRLEAPGLLKPLVGEIDVAMTLDRRAGIVTTPRLFEGSLLASGPEARTYFERLRGSASAQVNEFFATDTVLGSGMAFELEAGLAERVEDPDNFLGEYPRRGAMQKGVRLALHATAGNDPTQPIVGWSLGLAGALRMSLDGRLSPEEERYRPGSPAPASELVRPTRRPAVDVPLLVILRAPFDSGLGRSLVLFVELGAPPAGGEQQEGEIASEPQVEPGTQPLPLAELVAHRKQQLELALTSIEARRLATLELLSGKRLGDFLARTVPEAYGRLEALRDAKADLRPALLFLAGAVDASLAMDALLALRPSELATLTAWLLEDRRTEARDPLWSLERWSWQALLRAAASGELAGPGAPAAASPGRAHGELAALE
ncbi:MAG: hypothetical protein P1V81_07355, partial [Planctomycetota bacterium]|nr:hypothetical protein [Planctomycetota bacterium]